MKYGKVSRWFLISAMGLLLAGCLGSSGGSGTKGSLRVLNVSPGYESIDLLVNDGTTDSDTTLQSGVARNTVSEYAALKANSYTVKFRRNGASAALLSTTKKLAEDEHVTFVTYGETGNFGVVALGDDRAAPSSGKAKLDVVGAFASGSVSVYFTNETDALSDVSPAFSLSAHSTSTDGTIDSGTYRVRVTTSGDTSSILLDVSGVTLDSKQVATLLLTDSSSGVLVNAILLSQRGTATLYSNGKARIRGAVGIANGTTLTASVGGTRILTSAASGTIGSAYVPVMAGMPALGVGVDGVQVSVSSPTLAAGTDYTLLFWSDASGLRTTLITDDNHVSRSGNAKVRLLNGMSGLGGPITLLVDYSPIAESIGVGEISGATELSAGTDYQLDVTNSQTTASLLSRASVSLSASSNYTMFLAGTAGAASGVLRKDR